MIEILSGRHRCLIGIHCWWYGAAIGQAAPSRKWQARQPSTAGARRGRLATELVCDCNLRGMPSSRDCSQGPETAESERSALFSGPVARVERATTVLSAPENLP